MEKNSNSIYNMNLLFQVQEVLCSLFTRFAFLNHCEFLFLTIFRLPERVNQKIINFPFDSKKEVNQNQLKLNKVSVNGTRTTIVF